MSKLFTVKKLYSESGTATGLALCVENAFRPTTAEKEKVETTLRLVFQGATGVIPHESAPTGYVSNGSRVLAWGDIEPSTLERAESVLKTAVAGLNAIYSYQRR